MRIFNQEKTEELTQEALDFEKGRLKDDKLFVAHHEAVAFKKGRTAQEIALKLEAQGVGVEIGYDGKPYRILEESEQGGRLVEEIKDEPDVQAEEAYDEYEDVQVYVPYTEEELKKFDDERRHAELKEELVKVMEDIEQEQLGIVRNDYAQKRVRAAEIINELRVLEGKAPREVIA